MTMTRLCTEGEEEKEREKGGDRLLAVDGHRLNRGEWVSKGIITIDAKTCKKKQKIKEIPRISDMIYSTYARLLLLLLQWDGLRFL